MRTRFRIAVVAATLLVVSCTSTPAAPTNPVATFIVVRHGEKAMDDPRDPRLNAAGRARASPLSHRLGDRDIAAVYATPFRRTRDTAAPTASAHGLKITPYDAALPADTFAKQLRQEHGSGTVLVVGHSNTVPGIVAALCGCHVAAIDERVYDHWYEVDIDAGDKAVLHESRY